MTWTLACGDVTRGCSRVLSGDSREAVLEAARRHTAAEHGLPDLDPRTAFAVEAALRLR